jgi:hypothetical protein
MRSKIIGLGMGKLHHRATWRNTSLRTFEIRWSCSLAPSSCALLWTREVVAALRAVHAKSRYLRERMYAHLLRLGPTYAADERVGELATTATEWGSTSSDVSGELARVSRVSRRREETMDHGYRA